MNLLLNNLTRHLRHAAALMVFILFTTCSYANDFKYQRYHKTNKKARLKKDGKPRMFFIAVIDSKDATIGERCKADLMAVSDEFEYVAGVINAKWVEPKIIEGDKFSKPAVDNAINVWLKNQHPSTTDMVIFYYSGHGFRFPADTSKYPRMWLKTATDSNLATNNLRLEEDIYKRIITMGASVNIILSDCCNSTAADANTNYDNVTVTTHRRPHSDDGDRDDSANGHKLFITDEHLSILAAAAGKGELAGGKPEDGGFFTAYFLDALDDFIDDDSKDATWENIFKYAAKSVLYQAKSALCPETKHNENGRCVQNAVFEIYESE